MRVLVKAIAPSQAIPNNTVNPEHKVSRFIVSTLLDNQEHLFNIAIEVDLVDGKNLVSGEDGIIKIWYIWSGKKEKFPIFTLEYLITQGCARIETYLNTHPKEKELQVFCQGKTFSSHQTSEAAKKLVPQPKN